MSEVANATFVGRQSELDAIGRFLERIPTGPVALLIEGAAANAIPVTW